MKKIVGGIYQILCWIIVFFMGAMTVMVFVNTVLRNGDWYRRHSVSIPIMVHSHFT